MVLFIKILMLIWFAWTFVVSYRYGYNLWEFKKMKWYDKITICINTVWIVVAFVVMIIKWLLKAGF